jgi:peptidoglycan/xylan/chitin deacetylase (PgdA/CDA1 family)
MYYPVLTPWWLKMFYRGCVWQMPASGNKVYLTFDDGPHPEVTPVVLDILSAFQAKATFFCIGNNVRTNAEIYDRILREGHVTGNHTYHHLNGWKVTNEAYFRDIAETGKLVRSHLFRPPYGRITPFQIRALKEGHLQLKIIMWTLLSGDFDTSLTPEACCESVLKRLSPGQIIVFHDSKKAEPRVRFVLPALLEKIRQKGLECAVIS